MSAPHRVPASPEEIAPDALASVLSEAGAPCPAEVLPGLAAYLAMLTRWNRSMNLVGSRTWREAASDLVADCLRLADFVGGLPLPKDPVCLDLGSGAGIPGVPLRLVRREGTCRMVERRTKRALFLSQVLGTLDLPRTFVFEGDAGDALEKFAPDLVTSRAFMPWRDVLALAEARAPKPCAVVFMTSKVPAEAEVAAASRRFVLRGSLSYPAKSGSRAIWAAADVRPGGGA